MTSNFFSPLSFVAVFGSGIRNPGWVKIRIRDKHPGSATLGMVWSKTSWKWAENDPCLWSAFISLRKCSFSACFQNENALFINPGTVEWLWIARKKTLRSFVWISFKKSASGKINDFVHSIRFEGVLIQSVAYWDGRHFRNANLNSYRPFLIE